MLSPSKERRELELFWGFIWPALGATFVGIAGAIIGLAMGGIVAALLCALVGGLIGLETGHFFGAFVRLFYLPWLEFVRDGRYGPVVGRLVAVTAIATLAWGLHAGAGVVIFLSCTAFVGGAWTVAGAQLAFSGTSRSSPQIDEANAFEGYEDSQDPDAGNRCP